MCFIAFDDYLLDGSHYWLTNTHTDSADFAENQCVAVNFESCLLKNHAMMAFLKPKFAYSVTTRF
jgi:hypothetical protein